MRLWRGSRRALGRQDRGHACQALAGGGRMIRDILVTICGLMALLTPLLLWVAWSKALFWLIMAGGCTALLVIYVLIWTAPDEHF
jgi:hypothetical protein